MLADFYLFRTEMIQYARRVVAPKSGKSRDEQWQRQLAIMAELGARRPRFEAVFDTNRDCAQRLNFLWGWEKCMSISAPRS